MRIATFVTMAVMALMGAIGNAQNVTYDFDRSADFSQFKTYAWVRGTTIPDELNHDRVVAAIDKQLAQKGLVKVDAAGAADVLVAYHATFDRDLQVTGFASGWGGYRFGGFRSATARTEEILVGTIVVDVVNAATRTIVWRAMASKDVDVHASAEKREKSINRTAAKLFQHYPPKR
jgi:hypothetical protein